MKYRRYRTHKQLAQFRGQWKWGQIMKQSFQQVCVMYPDVIIEKKECLDVAKWWESRPVIPLISLTSKNNVTKLKTIDTMISSSKNNLDKRKTIDTEPPWRFESTKRFAYRWFHLCSPLIRTCDFQPFVVNIKVL